MIRSTKTTLKFSNKLKLEEVHDFIDEYRTLVGEFVDLLWKDENVTQYLPKETTSKVKTWLSARMIQCAGKQASGVVRGTRKKQEQRLFMIDKLTKDCKFDKANKLQEIYDNKKVTKPDINDVEPELDPRFISIDLENSTSFDGWVKITSIGQKKKFIIPFKKTKHFNKMLNKGNIKKGIRLSKKTITFMFDIPDVDIKPNGSTIGIDVGQVTALSSSTGWTSSICNHGHDLNSITASLSRKKKGSKSFKKAQDHRKNYINWSINQLNLTDVNQVNLENIKYLKQGKRNSRKLSHWTYTAIFDKLESYCTEHGVRVHKVTPAFTSQRCSSCGWVHVDNRKQKTFKCCKCGFTADADLNASTNISLQLQRKSSLHDNKTGFYLNEVNQVFIVPDVQ